MNDLQASRRKVFLDVVSGLMIVHMIMGHVLQHSGLWYVEGDQWYRPVRMALFFFMPWFYFKAGVFLSRKREVGAFVRRDVRRLLVPFVVWTAIGSLCYIALEAWLEPRPWIKMLASPVKSVWVNGSAGGNLALWFLLSLFWVRCVYRLLPAKGEWAAMAGALAIGWLLCSKGVILPLSLSTLFPGLLMLLIGTRCKGLLALATPPAGEQRGGKVNKCILGGGKIFIIILFAAGVIYVCPGTNMRMNEVAGPYPMAYLLAWLGCLSIAWVGAWLEPRVGHTWVWRALAWTGRESMALYVVHWIPIFVANRLLRHWWPDIDMDLLTWLLLAICLLVLALVMMLKPRLPRWMFGEEA